jgi:predicted ATPase
MSEPPVLARLLVCGDPLLPFLDLDLGAALDASVGGDPGLCLVGPNGTGKSALLERLHEAVTGIAPASRMGGYLLAKFRSEEGEFYLARSPGAEPIRLRAEVEASPAWERLAEDPPAFAELREIFADELEEGPAGEPPAALWCDESRCLVDGSAAEDFADFLERSLRKREDAFYRFLRDPENRERVVAEVESEFEARSPESLAGLRQVWDALLAPVGLGIDFGSSGRPFVDGAGAALPLVRLGSALRKALWRTGLADAMGTAVGTRPKQLFLDEPDEGLHPVIAAKLVSLFRAAAGPGAALFVATSSPFVAAAFPPARRLLLGRGSDGMPTFTSSAAPEGASFDELLRLDFGLGDPSAKATPRAGAASGSKPETAPEPPVRDPEIEEELADLIDGVISFRQP